MMEISIAQPYSFCQMGQRSNQEDARYPDSDTPAGYKGAFVVCDGVGGRDKGEVASRTVADAIGSYIGSVDRKKPFAGTDFGKALDHAYRRLYAKMHEDTREMATTMVCVCFNGSGAFCAHIGDSRIYQIRPEVGIIYRSDDHSLVNALVHSGNLLPQEAIDHPRRNVITRSMTYVEEGIDRPSATAIQLDDIEAGDYFFLCTDGVLNRVDEDELYAILSSSLTDREKMERIAEKSRDSSDNNTAFLIRIDSVKSDEVESAEDVDNENPENSTTERIVSGNPVAGEIFPAKGSDQNKFSSLFKKIFRHNG